MARITAEERKRLPAKDFAGPGRSFPVTDKEHARKALQMVGRSVKAGNTSPAAAARIRSRANGILQKS